MKFISIAFIAVVLSASVCSAGSEVVVYTSEDKVFSEPVLQAFEKKTDIKVRAIWSIV
jgi:iron(III) transport system substrate-binding protein